jgi:hypothetical protein
MFALRARPSASPVRHSARRRPIPPATKAPRTKPEEYRASSFSARSALFVRISAQERNLTPLFSSKRALSGPPSLRQPLYSQSVPHSSTTAQILTLTFPVTSTPFVRSFAKERKSTPLFSCACALFCANVGVRQKQYANSFAPNEFLGCYSGVEAKNEGLKEQP